MMKARSQGKNNSDFSISDIYESFIEERKEETRVTKKQFNHILKTVNHEFMRLMILENVPIDLPHMGQLNIFKYRKNFFDKDGNITNKSVIDYGATNKLWKSIYPDKSYEEILKLKNKPIIYQTNDHFNGYFCKFGWNYFKSDLKGKNGYMFKATRDHNRYLSQCLKDPNLKIDFHEKLRY